MPTFVVTLRIPSVFSIPIAGELFDPSLLPVVKLDTVFLPLVFGCATM